MSRRQHRGRRNAATIRQLPWRTVENPFAPVDVLNEEQVWAIMLNAVNSNDAYLSGGTAPTAAPHPELAPMMRTTGEGGGPAWAGWAVA